MTPDVKQKFMEVAVLIAEFQLYPDRIECLKEARKICQDAYRAQEDEST